MARIMAAALFVYAPVFLHLPVYAEKERISEARSARQALTAFCVEWKRGQYNAMFQLLSTSEQDKWGASAWEESFVKEARTYGLLKSFRILGQARDTGNRSLWKVELEFSNLRIGALPKSVWLIQEGAYWKLDGALMGEPPQIPAGPKQETVLVTPDASNSLGSDWRQLEFPPNDN